eukprot:COSAG06_NODE_2240_length_7269_cov_22.278243_1_plen_108_part_00
MTTQNEAPFSQVSDVATTSRDFVVHHCTKSLGSGLVGTRSQALLGRSRERKTHLLRHFMLKLIILLRQARDKHRENSKRDVRFAGGEEARPSARRQLMERGGGAAKL